MKTVIHERFGAPRDVLRIIDAPPEQPAADEVVVRMEAAAMHIADLRTIEGAGDFQFPLPRTPGFEGIGRIVRVGTGVTQYKVGDRVVPPLASGTFREEVRGKAAGCMPAPEGDAVQLSLLTVNGPTAEVLLEDFAALAPGDWLIQNAANSSCGRYLIRLARIKGVRTVNVVRRAEMVDELRELGGDVVLVDGPDLAARVAAAVGGAPVKVGIDAVAGAATQRIAECLAPGSTVASYGSMSGEPCHLDFYLMFRRDIRLVGVAFVRQFERRTHEQVRDMYARLARHMASGELRAKIAGVYPLERVVDACERAGRTGAERDGKVVISFS
jgi:NADPH:quinone reductase-like Zn-dependent oxidoreductase